MAHEINLLVKREEASFLPITRKPLFLRGGIALVILIFLVAVGVGIYAYILQNETVVLAKTIEDIKAKIASYHDVEEKKSVITLKVDDLKKIYAGRFDYVKALDDIQKLFVYSLTISSISLSKDGSATVTAVKTGPIAIVEQQALATNITKMNLFLTLSSSNELQDTVDNFKSFLGKGLTSVTVGGSQKHEDNTGYDVQFVLTLGGASL